MIPAFIRTGICRNGCLWVLGLLLAVGGCSRSQYVQQADSDVANIIAEKDFADRWAIECFDVEMDPRSRYYEVYDEVRPPMPEDDPVSHQLMHYLDGKKGWKHWHAYGDRPQLENPFWEGSLGEYADVTPEGALRLNLEESIRLARIHSPNYQEQLEELYLSALDVSTERFRFDVQFFGGLNADLDHRGSERPGGESNIFRLGRSAFERPQTLEFRRQFATAGELLVGFANEFVWEFSGPDASLTTSLVNFSIIQPLLRAGGRQIALEQLTIAERGLLANLRAFQFWRQGFYTEMAVGSDGGIDGPSRRGGFFGGTGLTGFTGQGTGGFGGVGAATGFGRGGFGGDIGGAGGAATTGAGGGAGTVGGFIGLLQELQQLRNREENLNLQLRTLALIEETFRAGLIDYTQVLQFRQSIETEQASILQARNAFADSLDVFKSFRLGLPPSIEVELDDSLIAPFRFIDPRMSTAQNDVAAFLSEFGELPEEPAVEDLQQALQRVNEIRSRLPELIQLVEGDLQTLDERSAERMQGMTGDEQTAFLERIRENRENLNRVKTQFNQTTQTLQELRESISPDNRSTTANRIVAFARTVSGIAQELSLIQVRSRVEAFPSIEPIDLTSEAALEIARANRLDWMNNRAALVDSWRLIEFNANALESDLDIFFEGDMGNLNDGNPVDFRDENGSLRAGLRFDAPLTRLLERNNFRQQLINYQQARRQLIQFEDGISRSLRSQLRTLRQLRLNLEFQRRAVAIAVDRVDQGAEAFNQPGVALGATLTRDLIESLDALRDAQNNFMSVWLNHHAARMELIRDLGLMQVDENDIWIDIPIEEALRAKEQQLPPAVPDTWLQATEEPDGEHPLRDNPEEKPEETAMEEWPLLEPADHKPRQTTFRLFNDDPPFLIE